jgi:ribonuclease HI
MSYKVNISRLSKEEQAKSYLKAIQLAQRQPSTLVVYIDASLFETAKEIGVGLVSYELSQVQTKSIIWNQKLRNLGQEQLVYNDELEGTTLAIKYISRIAEKDKYYIVYSDNQASLLRLKTPSNNLGQNYQLRAIIVSKLILAKRATISLEWVPRYTDINRNEIADKLAK